MNRRIAFIATLLLLVLVPTASATFVEMEKTHTPIQPNYHSGDTIQFTVIVSVHTVSAGPILSIMDFRVRDTLPDGLTYVPASQTSVPAPMSFTDHGNGTLVWDYGTGPFTSDPHATITFQVTVDPDAPRGETIINEARRSTPRQYPRYGHRQPSPTVYPSTSPASASSRSARSHPAWPRRTSRTITPWRTLATATSSM